jgi:hypothetical protein
MAYREWLDDKLEILRNADPDVLVQDLQITSEELLDQFPSRAEEFIKENWEYEHTDDD